MPAEVVDDPLGIACEMPSGKTGTVVFGAGPCPRLARDLLTGLADLVHPHGPLTAWSSVVKCVIGIRRITAALEPGGFDGGAADLSRARLVEFWMATGHAEERSTRSMLARWDLLTAGLRPEVRALVQARRSFNQPACTPLVPYSENEWTRLITTCRTVVDDAFAAHQAALAAAERARDPARGGWSRDNGRWLLSRRGPMPLTDILTHMGVTYQAIRGQGLLQGQRLVQIQRELFPHTDVVIGYQLLFGAYSGIVPDGIDSLGLGDIDWAGDRSVLLGYVKGRTARESLNLPGKAVRLLQQWLTYSALLRGFAAGRDREALWLRYLAHAPGGPFVTVRITDPSVRAWVRRHGLLDDSGQPMAIHRQRIRTTFQSRRDRRHRHGSGRATIDPNHTPQVEGDHYLTATSPDQRGAVDAIIEDAQVGLLRRARTPKVLDDERVAEFAARFPDLVADLDLNDATIAELVGGHRDVFTAACGDQLAGLHGPKGKPCPARPWVCLLCPLAVFAPRHAPNLLRLKAFFLRQWRQMPCAHFLAVFGPYADRLDEVLDRFPAAVVTAAANDVGDTDDEVPLHPEEFTQ
ncbi:hypothetical protein IU459_36270 [Nocardia amamiensis]|uniref:Uncharacterized protein n=1 Tax=Nocardia amamiensis TaxID=404578 RepID=A0ABS0D269_9NOCA|nr:hypothetical protein [Nocardia amamiensis]MBF6302932.1 hypothetical protein [Nocardia amamiensis]